MLGRTKDWGSIATRYDERHHLFMCAVALAVIYMFWK